MPTRLRTVPSFQAVCMSLSVLSILALMTVQPSSQPLPVVAELCNDTSARVAFAVVRPGSGADQVQRGWFTVEAGQCLEGAIGQGRGGQAYVHAYSGAYVWPASGPASLFCTPAVSHERGAAGSTECAEGERALPYAPAINESRGNHRRLSFRVGCADLNAEDARLCSLGLRGEDGFAERVRTLEVCNITSGDDRIAVVSSDPEGAEWQVSPWTLTPAGECTPVWRGLTPSRTLYVASEAGLPAGERGDAEQSFCIDPDTGLAVHADAGTQACPYPGATLARAGVVRFSPQSGRFSMTLND